MKNLIVFLGLFVFALISNAQNTRPIIQWQKCFGGTGSEIALSVQQTKDLGYIVAGYTDSHNGDVTGFHPNLYGGNDLYDYWVVKIDSSGDIQWQKCLGGSGQDEASSIMQTSDGGYIVAGYSILSHDGDLTDCYGQEDYWVVKLDSTGYIEWQKSLGGSNSDQAFSVKQTFNGGYIVAGFSASSDMDVTGNHNHDTSLSYTGDFWVVKLNIQGNIQWQKCLGGSGGDFAFSIQQTNDSGYVVAGYSQSKDGDVTGSHDTSYYYGNYWVVKLDTSGNIQWQKSLGGTNDDIAESIQQTSDGGYIVAGYSYSNDGDVTDHFGETNTSDYWIVKLNSSGIIQWQKSMGGTGNDRAASIQQTDDGGYIIAGDTYSNNGYVSEKHDTTAPSEYSNYWIAKLDTSGLVQWQKSLGGTSQDIATSIQQTSDGGFIVAGMTFSNNGDVTGFHGGYYLGDYWIVKLGYTNSGIIEQQLSPDISIYPNPSSGKFSIEALVSAKYVQISNSLGQIVEKRIVKNLREEKFEIEENGIYFVQIVTDKEIITKKVVISNE